MTISDENRGEIPVCPFCGQELEVSDFTPDRYGGHWKSKLCKCSGAEEARAANKGFRKALGV